MEIYGDTTGLSPSETKALQRIYRRKVPLDRLTTPELTRAMKREGFSDGQRLIHTHLRNEPLSRDDLVDLTRLHLDMVVAICLAPGEERALCLYYGHNFPAVDDANEPPFRTFGPIPYAKAQDNPAEIIATLEQEFARAARQRIRFESSRSSPGRLAWRSPIECCRCAIRSTPAMRWAAASSRMS